MSKRIVAVGHDNACFHAMLSDRTFQFVQLYSRLRIGGDFDELHAQRCRTLEDSEKAGAFHRDYIAGLGYGPESQVDGLKRATGDYYIARRKVAAHVGGAAGQLATQRVSSRRGGVMGAVRVLGGARE